MKILHIGVMANGKGEGINKAFIKVSDSYLPLETGDPNLQSKAAAFDYDLCFIQVQNDRIGDRGTVEALRPIIGRGFTVNWTGDMLLNTPGWMWRLNCDVTAFSNQRDVDMTRAQGKRAEFLQIGIDPEIFKPEGEAVNGKDIVFFANNYGHFPLSGFRKQSAAVLRSRYGERFGLYGNGYPSPDGNYNVQGNDVTYWQGQEAAIYRGCKIAVSISHFNVARYTSDRLLRIMGCGAFPLVHHYQGVESDFNVGEEMVTFDSYNDLCERIDYWLENDTTEIRIKAAKKIKDNHTYDHMVQNIINMI